MVTVASDKSKSIESPGRFVADVHDYQLLGLRPAESRVVVIRRAAESRVKQIQTAKLSKVGRSVDEVSQVAFATYRLLDPRRRERFGERIQLCLGDDLVDAPRIPLLGLQSGLLSPVGSAEQPVSVEPLSGPLSLPSLEQTVAMELAEHHWVTEHHDKKRLRRSLIVIASALIAVPVLLCLIALLLQTGKSLASRDSSQSLHQDRNQLEKAVAASGGSDSGTLGGVAQGQANVDLSKEHPNIRPSAPESRKAEEAFVADEKTSNASKPSADSGDSGSSDLLLDRNLFAEEPDDELAHQSLPEATERDRLTGSDSSINSDAEFAQALPDEKQELDPSETLTKDSMPTSEQMSEGIEADKSTAESSASGVSNDLVAAPLDSTQPDGPAAVPSEEKLEQARGALDRLFADRIKNASGKDELIKIAYELQKILEGSPPASADRFVIAERLAVVLGTAHQFPAVLAACENLEQQYATSAWPLRLQILENAQDQATNLDQQREAVRFSLGLLELAISREKFDEASDIAKVSVLSAARAGDDSLRDSSKELREAIVVARKIVQAARKAEEKIAESPDDRFSHLAIANYKGLLLRSWDEALPHYQQSADRAWVAIAESDLSQPKDSEAQYRLAKLYLEKAKTQKSRTRQSILVRANYWLEKAKLSATGLLRAEIAESQVALRDELPKDWLAKLGNQFLPVGDRAAARKAGDRFLVPQTDLLGMVGRLTNAGQDSGILIRYGSGLVIEDAQITDLLMRVNQPRGAVQLELAGMITVTQETPINIVHSAGSAKGTGVVLVDGEVLGQMGGQDSPERTTYQTTLKPGDHTLVWRLSGMQIGASVIQVQSGIDQTAVPVYHTPALLAELNRLRTTLRVDIIRAAP